MIPEATVYPGSVRDAMAQWPTGIAVVTTADQDGWWWGCTADSFGPVSTRPPLISVCVDRQHRCRPAFTAADVFAVNVLRAGQEDLARVFASKRVAREKFDAVTHTVAHGVPVLDDALAWIACDLKSLTPAGDHTIGIGRVTHLSADDGAGGSDDPLLFFRGGFGRLA
jgi:flavin reductase (DIM6/NTAB) family NADH-FMN oxidoreductase RutF